MEITVSLGRPVLSSEGAADRSPRWSGRRSASDPVRGIWGGLKNYEEPRRGGTHSRCRLFEAPLFWGRNPRLRSAPQAGHCSVWGYVLPLLRSSTQTSRESYTILESAGAPILARPHVGPGHAPQPPRREASAHPYNRVANSKIRNRTNRKPASTNRTSTRSARRSSASGT